MNIFDFFKKKPVVEKLERGEDGKLLAEKQVVLDNISIHAMPERFRIQADKMNKAKTTGLVIIVGGVAFLLITSAVLYYFIFRQPSATEITESTEQTLVEPVTPTEETAAPSAFEPATTTPELSTLPIPENLATSTATTTPETVEEAEAGLVPGPDSDNDGLTDKEEGLLGTNSILPDSDDDGYTDGAELINLYDPASRGKLTDNPGIATYENKTFNYSLLYPKSFVPSVNGGSDSVMLKSSDNQFIQIVVQPNANKQTLEDWYQEQLGVSVIATSSQVAGSNWQGLKSQDGLTLYLMDNKKNYIFSLTYNPGESNVLDYANIYQLLIKSFTLKN